MGRINGAAAAESPDPDDVVLETSEGSCSFMAVSGSGL
jgi:hypothetical protein